MARLVLERDLCLTRIYLPIVTGKASVTNNAQMTQIIKIYAIDLRRDSSLVCHSERNEESLVWLTRFLISLGMTEVRFLVSRRMRDVRGSSFLAE